MKLDIYLNEIKDTSAQDAMTLLEDIMFLENFEQLNESIEDIKVKTVDNIKDIKDKVGGALGKGGVNIKQGKGLMHYFWNINKGIAKLFYHAFMAIKTGDNSHKINMKAQTQKYINALRRVFDIGDYKKLA